MGPSILSLPTEIRILIYDYLLMYLIPTTTSLLRLFSRPSHFRDPTSRCWRRSPSRIRPCAAIVALLLTCKRFYQELLPLFYGHKGTRFCFDFDGRAGLRAFLRGRRQVFQGDDDDDDDDYSDDDDDDGMQHERLGLLKNVEFHVNVYRRGRGWGDWMALVRKCLGKMTGVENLVFFFRGVRGEGEGEEHGLEGWRKEVTAIGNVVGRLITMEGGKLKISLDGRLDEKQLENAFLQGICMRVQFSLTKPFRRMWVVERVVGRTGFGVI